MELNFNEKQLERNSGVNSGTRELNLQKSEPSDLVIPEDTTNDVQKKVEEVQLALRNSPEVIRIAESINVTDSNAILSFGNEPAKEIAKFQDRILNTMKSNSFQDSGVLLKELTKVMQQFDKKDFEEGGKGFFSKMFKKAEKIIEQLLSKYDTMGSQIDKIYTEITKYKKDIDDTNKLLQQMYEENFKYYEALEKYVAAGQMITEELKTNYLPQYENKATSGEQMDLINLDNLRNTIQMFEQRVYDLEMAKMISLQTAPQIRLIQRGNYKLISKIHSAFVITIPVFKQGLIQAVALKRQKIVADSLKALDEQTNRMLLENAKNTALQSVEVARLAGSSTVKMETIEEMVSTIIQGVQDTKAIEEEVARERVEGTKRLHEIQNEYQKKLLEGK